jgi:hypothetical protein
MNGMSAGLVSSGTQRRPPCLCCTLAVLSASPSYLNVPHEMHAPRSFCTSNSTSNSTSTQIQHITRKASGHILLVPKRDRTRRTQI